MTCPSRPGATSSAGRSKNERASSEVSDSGDSGGSDKVCTVCDVSGIPGAELVSRGGCALVAGGAAAALGALAPPPVLAPSVLPTDVRGDGTAGSAHGPGGVPVHCRAQRGELLCHPLRRRTAARTACGDRTCDGHDLADVRGEPRRDLGQVRVTDLVEFGVVQLAPHHQVTHELVRLAERDAAPDKQLGQIGGEREPRRRSPREPFGIYAGGRYQPRRRGEHEQQRVHRVENRFLVLLQVPVVGERQALQRREQAGEVTDEAARPCRARVLPRPGSSSAA